MKRMFVMAALTAWLATSPAFAQTASEELQRAIFARDAQGNIDGAIQVYRQVANSPFATRDVSAFAQVPPLSSPAAEGRLVRGHTRIGSFEQMSVS